MFANDRNKFYSLLNQFNISYIVTPNDWMTLTRRRLWCRSVSLLNNNSAVHNQQWLWTTTSSLKRADHGTARVGFASSSYTFRYFSAAFACFPISCGSSDKPHSNRITDFNSRSYRSASNRKQSSSIGPQPGKRETLTAIKADANFFMPLRHVIS